jgi:hypothetical protein
MNVAKPITPTGSTSVTSMTEQPYHANSGILSHSRLWSQSSELAVFIGLARSQPPEDHKLSLCILFRLWQSISGSQSFGLLSNPSSTSWFSQDVTSSSALVMEQSCEAGTILPRHPARVSSCRTVYDSLSPKTRHLIIKKLTTVPACRHSPFPTPALRR